MARAQRISSGYGVQATGLTELRRALKEVGPEAAKEMVKVGRGVAKDVASEAKGKAASLGGVAAKAAPSLKATAGSTSAGVSLGGPSAPWAPGAEFGGGSRPTTQQFKPWRGNGPGAGYFLYPTIRDNDEKIESAYLEGIEDVMRKAGLL